MTKIIFLTVLIIGLVLGIVVISQQTNLFPKADISNLPKDIRVSNISDNSFTVSWITDKAVNGFVSFGTTEKLGETAPDDRDSAGPKSRLTHHVTLKNLNPSVTYFYKIPSGNVSKQTTAPTTQDTPSLPEPIFGKVSPNSEAIIYSNIGNSTLLSTYTREDGNFLITLNNARTKDLNSYISVSDSDQVSLEVKTSEGVTKKQIPANQRKSAIQINLTQTPKSSPKSSWPADLNNDGRVNVMDYATYLKQQFTK